MSAPVPSGTSVPRSGGESGIGFAMDDQEWTRRSLTREACARGLRRSRHDARDA